MQDKAFQADFQSWPRVTCDAGREGLTVSRRRIGPATNRSRAPLYTPQQRVRRDATRWTLVQGVLAPIQFLAFLVSLALIVRFFVTGQGEAIATASVLVKTFLLFTIMVTGAIWEKVVFGRWLFAPAFFWEDVVSMGVIALHVLYVWNWYGNHQTATTGFLIALLAYGTYVVNAAQFLLKLRAARRQAADTTATGEAGGTATTDSWPIDRPSGEMAVAT